MPQIKNPLDNLYVCSEHGSNENYFPECSNCLIEHETYKKYILQQLENHHIEVIKLKQGTGIANPKSLLRLLAYEHSDERIMEISQMHKRFDEQNQIVERWGFGF